MASDILSYNVVQDHEGISIKGYRGLRPPGDLIYSDLSVLKPWICMFRRLAPCHGDNLEISRSRLFRVVVSVEFGYVLCVPITSYART